MPATLPRILRLQGAYYSATGAWPLLHLPSFEAVTGPKRDRRLARSISKICLLDAALEVGLMAAFLLRRARDGRGG